MKSLLLPSTETKEAKGARDDAVSSLSVLSSTEKSLPLLHNSVHASYQAFLRNVSFS